MDKQLSLKDILNVSDIKTERVEVPEWGGYVIIQSMTAEARDFYEASILEEREDESGNVSYTRNLKNIRSKLVAACTIGPDGKRMFSNEQHVEALGSKNSKPVDRIFEACQKLNRMTDSEIEELAGN